MGVLTDLIIADKSEAERIANSSAPCSEWSGFDAKGHSEITLGYLLCILRGEDYDETVSDEFPFLAQASEEGAWVFELPNDLVVGLNNLSDGQIPKIISQWLETEEMQSADSDYAENFIKDLKSLATESISRQKSILMWMCL